MVYTMSQTEAIVEPATVGKNNSISNGYTVLGRKYYPLLAQLEEVQLYRRNKDDLLTSAQMLVLKYALSPAKLEKASFASLCAGFEILSKCQRLEAGQSTENHAILGSLKLELPKDK